MWSRFVSGFIFRSQSHDPSIDCSNLSILRIHASHGDPSKHSSVCLPPPDRGRYGKINKTIYDPLGGIVK